MPRPSPFHERTFPLCKSWAFKEWAGYIAPCRYDPSPIYEYTAFRKSAGLLDVTPLFKYAIEGKDAAAYLSRVCVRGFQKMAPGKVAYTCWCDEEGKVVDDGTVTRLDETRFFLTAAEPMLRWLLSLTRGFEVSVEDVTDRYAALALQGPTSRDLLAACVDGDVAGLPFFGSMEATLGGKAVRISRTGYTGDLGYEVWCATGDALPVWDALMETGRGYGVRPVGLDALDMTRIEAGFIMAGVDYFSAPTRLLSRQKSSPFEIGLDWTVNLKREGDFVGRAALEQELESGSTAYKLVGVEIDWVELERLYDSYGLPPSLPGGASRVAVPLWIESTQVGYVTSSMWSPILKRFIGLASVKAPFADLKNKLQVEHTVEYERRSITATIAPKPFFDPERKKA